MAVSGVNTPATAAAAYSPRECPVTVSGTIPRVFQTIARATSRENKANCEYTEVSTSSAMAVVVEYITSTKLGDRVTAAEQRRIVSRKEGSASKSSLPI